MEAREAWRVVSTSQMAKTKKKHAISRSEVEVRLNRASNRFFFSSAAVWTHTSLFSAHGIDE